MFNECKCKAPFTFAIISLPKLLQYKSKMYELYKPLTELYNALMVIYSNFYTLFPGTNSWIHH